MMFVHLINLPHRKDRLKSAMDEFASQDIVFKYWAGIMHEVPATGISRAFKRVVAYAKERKLDSVTIAEDDIKFTHKNSWKYFKKNIPFNYDIFLASYYGGVPDENYQMTWFRGMTLINVHERFYDTFLDLPEHIEIDVALEGKGKFFVCPKFAAIQYSGYSDARKQFCDDSEFVKDKVFYEG